MYLIFFKTYFTVCNAYFIIYKYIYTIYKTLKHFILWKETRFNLQVMHLNY